MTEEKAYQRALEEFQSQEVAQGLWAKAVAFSDGEEKKAEANYHRFRAEQILESKKEKIKTEKRTIRASRTNSLYQVCLSLGIIVLLSLGLVAARDAFWPKEYTYPLLVQMIVLNIIPFAVAGIAFSRSGKESFLPTWLKTILIVTGLLCFSDYNGERANSEPIEQIKAK